MCIIKYCLFSHFLHKKPKSAAVSAILNHLKHFKFWAKNLLILQLGFTQDLISPSKITISQKRVSIYSSLLIFIIHHYCGMFYNPRRVIVSNIDIMRCTQQAHVKISQKFKIFSKSHYLRLWAGKCATCAHIKKILCCLIHTYLMCFKINFGCPGVYSGQAATRQSSKVLQKTTSKKIFISMHCD